METQRSIADRNADRFAGVHVFLFSMAYLWTMLTLDVIYSLLLVHGYISNQMAAHRERSEARRLSQQAVARVPVASVVMQEDLSSGEDSGMERAA